MHHCPSLIITAIKAETDINIGKDESTHGQQPVAASSGSKSELEAIDPCNIQYIILTDILEIICGHFALCFGTRFILRPQIITTVCL